MKDKNMKNIKLLVIATLITPFLIVLGVIYNVFKSIFDRGVKNFLRYWLMILVQIGWAVYEFVINIFKLNIFYNLALFQDLLWNAIAGEFLEDCITYREETAFGYGRITVSASIGKEEVEGYLVPTGKWFSGVLDKAFNEPNHCPNSWERRKKYY